MSSMSNSLGYIDQKSVFQFQDKNEYIDAMVEDLCEWLNSIYELNESQNLNSDNFFTNLQNGVILCMHASNVQNFAEAYVQDNGGNRKLSIKSGTKTLIVPQSAPLCSVPKPGRVNDHFVQRTNIENFIKWCRSFNIPEYLTFETEDLMSLKNKTNVVVCLLEIAKIGGLFGIDVPDIIKLDQQIESENKQNSDTNSSIESKSEVVEKKKTHLPGTATSFGFRKRVRSNSVCSLPKTYSVDETDFHSLNSKERFDTKPAYVKPIGQIRLYDCFKNVRKGRKPSNVVCDLKTLDEKIKEILLECECEKTFPMKKIKDGAYEFGEKRTMIFVRILRNHVMVRVGGGWDILSEFLHRHDPCRKNKPEIHVQTILPITANSSQSNEKSNSNNKINLLPSLTTKAYKGIDQGMVQIRKNNSKIYLHNSNQNEDGSNNKENTLHQRPMSMVESPTNKIQSTLLHSPGTLEFQYHEMKSHLSSVQNQSPIGKSRSFSLCSQNFLFGKSRPSSKIPVLRNFKM